MGTIFHGNQPYSGGGVLNIVHKTWEQYQALSSAEKHDASKYYFVPDAPVQGVPGIVAEFQDEVDAINSKIEQQDKVSVTADGVKTYRQLFNELYGLIDRTKLSNRSVLLFKYTNGTIQYYNLGENAASWYCFSLPMAGSAGAKATTLIIASTQNACEYSASVGSTRTDYSTYIPQTTSVFEVRY